MEDEYKLISIDEDDKDIKYSEDNRSDATLQFSEAGGNEKLVESLHSVSITSEEERFDVRNFVSTPSKQLKSKKLSFILTLSDGENQDTLVVNKKEQITGIINIDSDNEDDFETTNNKKTNESSEKCQSSSDDSNFRIKKAQEKSNAVLTNPEIESNVEAPPKSTGKFMGDIINSSFTGEFDGFNYPFSNELRKILNIKFGLSKFQPNQLQVINAVLTGHDCCVLMPTGSSKSLCYQLPALLSKGATIIITPYINEVEELNSLDIKSCLLDDCFHNSNAYDIYTTLITEISTTKLLYITPKDFSSSNKYFTFLQRLHNNNLITRIVIDEAHRVSQWSDYFSSEYKKLERLKQYFPNVRMTVLTDTAFPLIRQDIEFEFGLKNLKWFLGSFNRPNLKYEVVYKNDKSYYMDEVIALIKEKYDNCCGIVFCNAENKCHHFLTELRKNGIKAAYFGGYYLTDKEKYEFQWEWSIERIQVICTTSFYNIKIDKPNIRFVIHISPPVSIERYYKDSSRAGHDGKNADCILFYNNADTPFMDEGSMYENFLNSYCKNRVDCRRMILLQRFGEIFDRNECLANKSTTCDNCRNKVSYEIEHQCYTVLMLRLTNLAETLNHQLFLMISPIAVRAMSREMPNTKEEMLKIPEMTKDFFEKYGEFCLGITRHYAAERKVLLMKQQQEKKALELAEI